MRLVKRSKLIFGVGINDADYNVVRQEMVDGKQRIVWRCPFYGRWGNMLQRCYSADYLLKFPTYIGCEVVEEWKYFSNFRSWMESQDWEGKQLDKDLLFLGNRIYGPETCVFLDNKTNTFLCESNPLKRVAPLGVF